MGKSIIEKEPRGTIVEAEREKGASEFTVGKDTHGGTPDFEAIENSAGFKELMRRKKGFLISSTILFLSVYIVFNLVISYTNLLNVTFMGDIAWVWFFAFGLFIMTWTLVTVYMKKAAQFDRMADETLKEFDYDEEVS
ncbi:DUF485 domain-containing protein [Sporosarcina limicola]|uniref:Uncharacterized membrane protein (DUF485 family) n=1 Tax=Sporosarcina limicola TaxID=34101 RepID=A0A927RGP1_9BACL|nr:DUF485 domain-containing protein [Sporosarcina limicola]MBE1556697.1 uncharacterized membrane protein (DUF485 family) [Sporosarcina limicola]